jgi:hypothetical protein
MNFTQAKTTTNEANYQALIVHHSWNRYNYDTKVVEFFVDNDSDAREKAIETFQLEYPTLGRVQEVHNIQRIKKFTLEDGIKVQKSQLEEWSYILNALAYNELVAKCEKMNQELREKGSNDGYQVFRGNEMQNFIGNLAITLKRIYSNK